MSTVATTPRADAPAETTAPALAVRGLTKAFGGLRVLDGVDLRVPMGSIVGVAGPNGAGKTTMLNIVSAVGRADAGEIDVFGAPTSGRPPHALAALGVARTFQNIRLFRGMTVLEQVACGAYRHRRVASWRGALGTAGARRERDALREEALRLLRVVDLEGEADRLAETLPYGLQRRIEIARALATRPRLVLLDEPTAGMNAADWTGIGELLRRLRDDGTTLLIVEHNMRLIETVCDEVAVLAAGRTIACGPPRETLREPAVRHAYFGS
ncbi:ABC transporter ATP-binding protein [Patulibacter sp. S7RM1-6]